jgi:hypothetical protein
LSCLSFIKQLGQQYEHIRLREKIELAQYGDTWVSFWPHVSRATVAAATAEKAEYKTTQDYIEALGKRIIAKVKTGRHIAFSHLNVRGAHPGSEANLLKRSEAYLPMALVNTPPGFTVPTIIQGHIHSPQDIGNIHIVGSPLYCGFGETENKSFSEIKIGDKNEITRVPTPFVPFIQAQVDMLGDNSDFRSQAVVADLIELAAKHIKAYRKPVMKFQVTISAANNGYNWPDVRKSIETELGGPDKVHVMPIDPKVVQQRITRDVNQKATLQPDKAVQVFLKRNLGSDPTRMKQIWKVAKPYLNGGTQ